MTAQIRRLGPDDAALLERIADGVFDAPVCADRLAAYLAEPGHVLLVALEDGVVVAQAAAVVHRHPDKPAEVYVDEVGVAPAHRRQASRRVCWRSCSGLAKGSAARSPGSPPRPTISPPAGSTRASALPARPAWCISTGCSPQPRLPFGGR